MKERRMTRPLVMALCCLLLPAAAGEGQVVVYVSMDEEHSRRILDVFAERIGIKPLSLFDTEDNKTVGLTNRIIGERRSPRCDVFWNNEAGQTVRLKNLGLLQPYISRNARDIPPGFKDPEGYWTGFAARARVLIYNTDLIDREELPTRLEDLALPRFKDRCAMSKPLTGTGLTHAGALYARWGKERAEEFYKRLMRNGVRWERGNAQVMREVSAGTRPFGMTDTDDARVASERGEKTDIIYLDQGESDMGTLVIPNTVMIIKGCPHPAEARKLVDFLLSPQVERMLAEGRSAQMPLHPGVPTPAHVTPVATLRVMDVDYREVGAMIESHAQDLELLFDAPAVRSDDSPAETGVSLLWAGFALALVLVLVVWILRGSRSAA